MQGLPLDGPPVDMITALDLTRLQLVAFCPPSVAFNWEAAFVAFNWEAAFVAFSRLQLAVCLGMIACNAVSAPVVARELETQSFQN